MNKIEISRGVSSGDCLMWLEDELKWVNVNIDPKEQKRLERKKKLERILNYG